MVCGVGICHSTSPRTELVTAVMTTTDSRGHTTVTVATSTTILVDGPNTSSTASGVSAVAQFVPSTVSKLPAIHTSDGGSGGGLSSGALGGIVAGVIVLLVAVIAAAVLIVMRLKNAERAAKAAEVAAESRHESSNGRSRSRKTGFGQPSVSEIDSATDIDPSHQFPIMRPSPRTLTLSTPSLSNDRSTPNFLNSGTSSPPIWGVPFSSNYVPSEASDGRQSSLDSYAHRDFNNVSRLSERVSLDSHGPTPTAAYGHSRQPSDTSELEGPHGVSELETYDESRRRSNSATRPAKAHVRLTSDPSRNRGDSNAAAVVAGSLGTVNEMHELHGHYGPPIGWQNKLRDN
ncbi:hypothetical protein F5Y17DRAFT_182885 [Xylariaceae sp. FL0594]|nr:hypothetical protein F5Y17DRAFT_182885 [Xylariaceae sp. FL0594]